MAAKQIDAARLAEFKEAFKLLDKDGDGNINWIEFEQFLKSLGQTPTKAEIKEAMDEFDTDGSGTIDLNEFVAAMAKRDAARQSGHLNETELAEFQQAFRMFDKDGDGNISTSELGTALRGLGQECTEAEVKAMIAEFDTDGSGEIDFQEFIAMLRRKRATTIAESDRIALEEANRVLAKKAKEAPASAPQKFAAGNERSYVPAVEVTDPALIISDNHRGGFGGRGRGRGRGDRGRGRGRGDKGEEKWVPVTKLGRLVQDGKIKSIEHIYVHALPIKEAPIVDYFFGTKLKDEVLKIAPVQKQTCAGQRTRFRAIVAVGDHDGHLGLGVKCAREVSVAIRGALVNAKMALAPIRRGYWGSKIGEPHTVPVKVTGRCGSILVRLIPAPRGTGVVAALLPKKLLAMAGVEDCYTAATGKTHTLGNFAGATFAALRKTYTYLTPDLWAQKPLPVNPYSEHSDFLQKTNKRR